MEESQATSARSEVTKFLLLVGVCVVVVLVVWLIRPLIFDRIVPAVMGEGQAVPADTTDAAIDETQDAPADSDADTATGDTEAEPAGETESEAVEEEAAVEAVEESTTDNAEDGETAVSDERTHTIQAGDTLFSIARKYGVTVEEIAEANGLEDVNRVVLGQTLKIPQP